jgi:transglutaminase-like putative cysteine protease
MQLRLPGTFAVSLLAGLTTWATFLAWTPFAEQSSGYISPIFGACLLVAITGMLLRSAHVPAVLVALAEIVVLGLWLDHRWVGGLAIGGWIPTPDSLRGFGDTISASIRASQAYAAPVPHSVPEFYPIMILAGAGTAVLVDFLACGLRRAPLAGLPLLAVYTAPVSLLDGGVSWLKFAAAALCFIFLLAADEARRLSHWGHQLSTGSHLFDSQATNVSTSAIWSAARKIGFTVTGLAVLVPIFVPTFTGDLFNGNGHGNGNKGSAVSITNPMVDLKRDLTQGRDVELLRATTTDPEPSYLRISVLDTFDGEAWRPSGRSIPIKQRADGRVTRPPGLTATVPETKVPWTISADSDFRSRWLPTPYPVYSVRAPGDWRYDQNTLDFISAADGQTTANLTYHLKALDLQPTAEQLAGAGPAPANIFTPYTALPKSVPQSVRTLARKVTAGARTNFQKAVRLQDWFRVTGGFTYSLQRAPGDGTNALVHFLGTEPGGRTGYCQQFSAAMALMGRTLGIPSRVAVGFLRPQRIGRDTYSFSSHDLHAWPEMYFEGVGWVRFEPTPASRTGGGVPSYTTESLPTATASAASKPSSTLSQQNRLDRATVAPGANNKSGGGGSAGGNTFLVGGLVLLAVTALAGLPRLTRSALRRRRWSRAGTPVTLAEAAWAELRDSALDLGLGWDDAVTLRTRARELVRSFGRPGNDDALGRGAGRGPSANPEATQALDRLVRLVERARFARTFPPDTTVTGEVQADVATCVQALRDGASRQRRTRATWLPVSLTARFADRQAYDAQRLVPSPGVDHAV